MPDETVNIRIKTETWKRMKDLKDEPGKTWDDVINELLEQTEDSDQGNPSQAMAD